MHAKAMTLPLDVSRHWSLDLLTNRMVRHSLGVAVAMTVAVVWAWPLSFLAPMLAQKFLSREAPGLPLKAGLGFVLVIALACVLAILFAMPLVNYPGVFLLFACLALFRITYAKSQGANPMLVTWLIVALVAIPMLGMSSGSLAISVAQFLVIGSAMAVVTAWGAYHFLPDPELSTTAAAQASPKDSPAPLSPDENARAAWISTLVVMPALLLFFTFQLTSHILVLIFIIFLSQEVDLAKGKVAVLMLLLGNFIGGLAAMGFYEILTLVPSIPFLFLLTLALSMLFSIGIMSDRKAAPLFNMAFSTMILIVCSIIAASGEGAGAKAWTRVAQIFAAGVYVVLAFLLIDLFRKAAPAFTSRAAAATRGSALLLVVCVGVLFTGCVQGPDFERSEFGQNIVYRHHTASGASIADTDWWNLFKDPTLQELIHTALDNNRNLQVAITRIHESRARLGIVRADSSPSVSYGGNATLSRSGVDTEPRRTYTTTEKIGGALDMRYELDFWGRIRRSTEAAQADLLATEEAYRTVTLSLIADVATTYFLLLDLDKRLEISENTAKTRSDSLEIMEARYKGGAISQVDYEQAAIQLADAQASIQVFKRLRAQTENGLSILLGHPPRDITRGARLRDQALPPALPPGLPAELLLRRPDILQAEHKLAAQTARIGAAEALRYPSFVLSGSLGGEVVNDNLNSGIAALVASISGPLFDGGRTRRQVDIEVARTKGLVLEYEQTILTAFREVDDALVAVETYQAEYEARARQAVAALSAAELTRVRYDGGWTGYLEVLENERSRFGAELKASEAQQLRLSSIVTLYRALGGGWSPATAKETNTTKTESTGTP